jgi:hypothetical protein
MGVLLVVFGQLSLVSGRERQLTATVDDYQWLVSEAARPWLELAQRGCRLRGEPRQGGATTRMVADLRKELSAERTHLVIEQVELRTRADEKFSLAAQMFFTRKGLEQATEERLAEYKANRFPANERCADLCCGLGGDLLALARRRDVVGVELDPIAALLAAANLAAHCLARDEQPVVVQDAAAIPVASFAAWHCDPDRRAAGKRTTSIDLFAPPLDALDRLLASNANGAIKLAPATEAPANWTQRAEFEWLGSRGECRQQVAWFGGLARHPGKRAATIVEASGQTRTIVGVASEALPVAQKLGRYLYEPHAAVLAAKLADVPGAEHGLESVSAGIGYLTGDGRISDAALAGFEVVEALPLDRKQLKAYCRQHGIGRLEVKKRGLVIDPAKLRKEVIGKGDEEATLIVSPVAGQARAIVARRIEDHGPNSLTEAQRHGG